MEAQARHSPVPDCVREEVSIIAVWPATTFLDILHAYLDIAPAAAAH